MSPQARSSDRWARYVSLLGLLGMLTGLVFIAAGLGAGAIAFLGTRVELISIAISLMCIGIGVAVASMLVLKAIIKLSDAA